MSWRKASSADGAVAAIPGTSAKHRSLAADLESALMLTMVAGWGDAARVLNSYLMGLLAAICRDLVPVTMRDRVPFTAAMGVEMIRLVSADFDGNDGERTRAWTDALRDYLNDDETLAELAERAHARAADILRGMRGPGQ